MSTPATQTAQAPVPQASVIPEPRSQVRIRTSPGPITCDTCDVHPPWECLVILERGSEGLQREGPGIFDVDHGVGVPHRHGGQGEFASFDANGTLMGGSPARSVGISSGSRIGAPMSTRTRRTLSPVDLQVERQDAPAGLIATRSFRTRP